MRCFSEERLDVCNQFSCWFMLAQHRFNTPTVVICRIAASVDVETPSPTDDYTLYKQELNGDTHGIMSSPTSIRASKGCGVRRRCIIRHAVNIAPCEEQSLFKHTATVTHQQPESSGFQEAACEHSTLLFGGDGSYVVGVIKGNHPRCTDDTINRTPVG